MISTMEFLHKIDLSSILTRFFKRKNESGESSVKPQSWTSFWLHPVLKENSPVENHEQEGAKDTDYY